MEPEIAAAIVRVGIKEMSSLPTIEQVYEPEGKIGLFAVKVRLRSWNVDEEEVQFNVTVLNSMTFADNFEVEEEHLVRSSMGRIKLEFGVILICR